MRAATEKSTDLLEKHILKPSKYPEERPKPGDLVKIHYVGYLEDGTVFDSSRARNEPFQFHLGESEVIDGWDMMVGTMAYEERAELLIGARYAYGEAGVPPLIPPNENLVYEIEVLDFGTPIDDGEEEDDDEEDEEEEEVDADGLKANMKFFWDEEPEREHGTGPGWQWKASGTGREIVVYVPLPEDLKARELIVDVRTFSLKCQLGAGEDKKVLDDELFAPISMDDSHWDLEKRDDGAVLIITLEKLDKNLKWEALLKQSGDSAASGNEANAEAATTKPAAGSSSSSSEVALEPVEVLEGASTVRGQGQRSSEVVDVDAGASGKTVKPRRK